MEGGEDIHPPLEGDRSPKVSEGVKKTSRKYTYVGTKPKDPKLSNLYGGRTKLRPWDMTDEQIEAVIQKRPDLARLWRPA